MSGALPWLGVVLVALCIVGALLLATWIVFPAARVVRGVTSPTRFVREALGPTCQIRDLGDRMEATADVQGRHLLVQWSATQTTVRVEGGAVDPTRAEALQTLARMGEVRTQQPLEWLANRPPDPQLRRAIGAALRATGP